MDLHQFQALEDAARDPGCPDRPRAELLARSLALWRGTPLADLSGGWVDRVRQAWHRRRIGVATEWAQALQRLGDVGPAIGPLTEMSAEYPLAESIAATLMNAMAAVGQGAEALDCYLAIRRRLADELGTDPGDQLRSAYQSILGHASSPVQATQRPTTPPTFPARATPAQLPLNVHRFVGRRTELSQLDALAAADRSGTVVAVIAGTAGVGKTALAVHWAHRARHHFPDGQLYVNLMGYAARPPTPPIEVLGRFLRALGCPPERVPADVDEAAVLYRTLIADKRVLVVLDNAASADQVRPLLPGGRACAALITSRDRLDGLAAINGARRLDLDVLTPAEARALLARVLGDRLVRAEPEAVDEVARLCAGLPLALRIAAAKLAGKPPGSISGYVAELTAGQRLAALEVRGDEAAGVRAAFQMSYTALRADARLLFRRLALVPGPDLSADAAAVLIERSPAATTLLLETLAGAHLLAPSGTQRYAMHDLIRLYAHEQSLAEDPDAVRSLARRRLFEWYRDVANAADRILRPAERPNFATPAPRLAFADETAALDWLDAEAANLAAAIEAGQSDEPGLTWQIAAAIYGWLSAGSTATSGSACTPSPPRPPSGPATRPARR